MDSRHSDDDQRRRQYGSDSGSGMMRHDITHTRKSPWDNAKSDLRSEVGKKLKYSFDRKSGTETFSKYRPGMKDEHGKKVDRYDEVSRRNGTIERFSRNTTTKESMVDGKLRTSVASKEVTKSAEGHHTQYGRTFSKGSFSVGWKSSVHVSPLLVALHKKLKGKDSNSTVHSKSSVHSSGTVHSPHPTGQSGGKKK